MLLAYSNSLKSFWKESLDEVFELSSGLGRDRKIRKTRTSVILDSIFRDLVIDDGIEPAAIGTMVIDRAMSCREEDAVAVGVFQLRPKRAWL